MTTAEQKLLRDEIVDIAEHTNFSRASLVPILRFIKEKYRGIDSEAMQIAADVLGIHPVEVDAVSTFYSFLTPETQGQYVFRLCQTYSCELAGKQEIVDPVGARPGHQGSARPRPTAPSAWSTPTAWACATRARPCW